MGFEIFVVKGCLKIKFFCCFWKGIVIDGWVGGVGVIFCCDGGGNFFGGGGGNFCGGGGGNF